MISVGSYAFLHLYPYIIDLAGVLQGLCSGVAANDLCHYRWMFFSVFSLFLLLFGGGEKWTFTPPFKIEVFIKVL